MAWVIFETFSPVVKPTTGRIALAITIKFNWPMHQMDVQNAFFYGILNEETYMLQPQGFVDLEKPTHVCYKLHRSIFGLKQYHRAWFMRLHAII